MKQTFISIVGLLLLLALTACKTNPNIGKTVPDLAQILRSAEDAAKTGTEAILSTNKLAWIRVNVVKGELEQLAKSSDIRVEQIVAIMRELPSKQLKSQTAQITVGNSGLSISTAGFSNVTITRQQDLKPLLDAIINGMKVGTASP